MCPPGVQFQTVIDIFSYPPLLSFSIFSLLFHISFIHIISLPSSFSISPRSLPFSHLATSIPHVLNWHILYLLSSPSLQYLVSLSWFPHLNLVIIFLSLALSLSRYFLSPQILPLSYTSHTSCCIWLI
jgi:hypothetical protein